MIYNLKDTKDRAKAEAVFNLHMEKQTTIELKKKIKRTLSQNSYLHLLLTWFACQYFASVRHVKHDIFKVLVNPDIFEYESTVITGEKIKEYRSTADIDSAEMTRAIERFRNWSGENGIYLPAANEHEHLMQIEIEASRNNYL